LPYAEFTDTKQCSLLWHSCCLAFNRHKFLDEKNNMKKNWLFRDSVMMTMMMQRLRSIAQASTISSLNCWTAHLPQTHTTTIYQQITKKHRIVQQTKLFTLMSSPRFLHRTSISNLRFSFMSGSRCSSASTFMSAIDHGLGGLNTCIHMHMTAVVTWLIYETQQQQLLQMWY